MPRNASASGLPVGGFRFRHLHRSTGLLPRLEPAFDMGNGPESHILCGLGRERRAPAGCAEEDETLVLREDILVIGAFRVDPEFEHPARAMKGLRIPALALQFAGIADIDE